MLASGVRDEMQTADLGDKRMIGCGKFFRNWLSGPRRAFLQLAAGRSR